MYICTSKNVENVCLDGCTITSKTKINIFLVLFLHTTSPSQLFGHRLPPINIFFKNTIDFSLWDKQCIIVSPLKLQFLPRFRALTAIYVYSSVLLLLLLYVVLVVVVLVCSVHLITNSIFGPFLILDNPTLLWPGNPKWPPHCNTHINTMVFKP